MIDKILLKLAAYLDEVDDDPIIACQHLAKHKINYVVIRHVYNDDICDITDLVCQRLRKAINDNNLSVVSLNTNLDVEHLSQKGRLDRLFDLASYFQAGFIKLGIKDAAWLQMISERCLAANIVPLYEISEPLKEPSQMVQILAANRRWKLLYDPAQLIVRQNQDPFIKYWTLLKKSVAAIDLHDYRIGYGYKPVGYGDARIKLTIQDAISNNYRGWYFLEPSLGRQYGSAISKAETFQLAYETLKNLEIKI